jgi:hypothetical protein
LREVWVQDDCGLTTIFEGVAVAGFKVGFGWRAFRQEHRVVVEFDMILGDRRPV